MYKLTKINERAFDYYPGLQRFKQHVEAHLSDHISLETAATIAHMEKKYFSVFFHRKVGVTYTHWLTSVRIEKAESLIKTIDSSLTRIGGTVGFRDFRTFERAFKKYTGLTPMKFKKLVRPS